MTRLLAAFPLLKAMRRLGGALLLSLAVTAAAQDYPSKVVRIIVPTSTSGSVDIYARLVARDLQTAFGQSFIVENRPGATGMIGSELARRAAPDGYTLMFSSNTTHVLGPLPREPRPFDAVADFTSITKLLRYPLYLLIHPSVPVRTLNEFIAFAKGRPGELVYASAGLASMSHVAIELFTHAAGVRAIHSPYKGPTPALQAVAGGEAHFLFNNIGTSQALVAAGKLRGLAITGDKRSPVLPQMPTMAELGLRGFENVNTWVGSFAPAHLPQPILNKLSGEITRIMRTPEMEKRVLNDGYIAVVNTPSQFRSEILAEVEVWSRVVRERGIKAE
jgi:tripartite-type tricarboxylate transporter receptor subunit TctC